MSDREGFGGGDDEHTLPKATVYKLISGASGPSVSLSLFGRVHLPGR